MTKIEEACEAVLDGLITVAEIAGAMGMSTQKAHSYLTRAVAAGYLRKDATFRPHHYATAPGWRQKMAQDREPGGYRPDRQTKTEQACHIIAAAGRADAKYVAEKAGVPRRMMANRLADAAAKGWLAVEKRSVFSYFTVTRAWHNHVSGVDEGVAVSKSYERLCAVEYVAPRPTGMFAGTPWHGIERRVTNWSRA
jgi:hypothetical protein